MRLCGARSQKLNKFSLNCDTMRIGKIFRGGIGKFRSRGFTVPLFIRFSFIILFYKVFLSLNTLRTIFITKLKVAPPKNVNNRTSQASLYENLNF